MSPRTVANEVVDHLLRLQRTDRINERLAVLRAIDSFPLLSDVDRATFIRSWALHDAQNRILFRTLRKAPVILAAIARLVPTFGSIEAMQQGAHGRPIIVNLLHFGQSHFVYAVVARHLRGRNLYAVHAGGYTAPAVARFFLKIGVTPIQNDRHSLLRVSRLSANDANCAIIFAFDAKICADRGKEANSQLFGRPISTPSNLAYIADVGNAQVFTVWGEAMLTRPRVGIAGPYEVDRALPPTERKAALTNTLLVEFEQRMRAAPSEWEEWFRCASNMEADKASH